MLKALFSSNTRVKLLTTFLLHPSEEFFIRELTRKLDEQINSIRRELDNLKKIGLLKSKMRNRKKYYTVDPNFPIFEELKSMFLKSGNAEDELIHRISQIEGVEFLLLNGVFVEQEASVDLLIVGDVNKNELQKILTHTPKGKEDLKFAIISKKDFFYRLECKDKFVFNLLQDRRSMIVVNKIKRELEKFGH